MKTKKFFILAMLIIFSLVISACAPAAGPMPAAPGGEAAAASGAEEFTTPHPILSDLRVRQALAYCLDRDSLIASVYPYVEDGSELVMDSFLPKTHWAYSGPYADMPMYDPEAGMALLDEAGWTLADGASVRSNADGESLVIKFTTTNAQFRQTWSAVAIQNWAACGIQVIPTYAPGSWWFGDTTGLARRDFELGAFAWVGQTEPAGRTLYACDQVPLPSNNWEGQNYMGWCNQTASDGIVMATNTLLREDRVAAYNTVQQEFAKDVVSIPVFQRAEAEAWSSNLTGIRADATEYATANLAEWALADGGDTIVIGMTQEPDSLWAIISSMAASALVRMGIDNERTYTQYDYDFQPRLQSELSTLESGLATNSDVEVNAGDMVYNTAGDPVALENGVAIFDKDNNEVVFDGTPVTMKQLAVTYKFNPFTWSDGTAGTIADFELARSIDCSPDSGATTFITCNSIQDVTWGTDALEYSVTYLPGVQTPTYMLAPFAPYPSQRVISDGRVLADVPAAEWQTLPEITERPLSWGPYMVTEWTKGQSLVLEANPYYAGEVVTPNVIFVFVADTNQAVAQLLNGDVDYLDDSTLGAGAEVQTVIDAANSTGNVQYEISASSTWEHIDINLFTK